MCHLSCVKFLEKHVCGSEIADSDVLEVGSLNINGSVRSVIEKYRPHKYCGVDVIEGQGVDLICSVYDILKKFGDSTFEIVVSTEMLEHVRDWHAAIINMDAVLKPGGYLYLTTRSRGFGYHGYPYDYWRFEIEDLKRIYNNYEIVAIEPDDMLPGVFMKARKLNNTLIISNGMKLYSMLTENYRDKIYDIDIIIFKLRYFYSKNKQYLPKFIRTIMHRTYKSYRKYFDSSHN